jgi:endonuclease/exonuclease/phosphatase (EEP) superfamily protein YafD
MLSFLFWNINRKPLLESVTRMTLYHQIDVLILIESEIEEGQILDALNSETIQYHGASLPIPGVPSRFQILTRFPAEFLEPCHNEDRMTIRRLNLPAKQEILIAAVHFPSKLEFSEEDQSFESTRYAETIATHEQAVGHARTIVVGDINMNPFEPGMVAARGFNAVMTRALAERRARRVQGITYRFFYNPMWGRFGDTRGPGGSYYYDNSGRHDNHYWNVFDQVLLRPDILPFFSPDDLDILTDDGEYSLLDDAGRPDIETGSDHLPLLFRLSL